MLKGHHVPLDAFIDTYRHTDFLKREYESESLHLMYQNIHIGEGHLMK